MHQHIFESNYIPKSIHFLPTPKSNNMTDRDLDMDTIQGAPDKATTMTSITALPCPVPNLPRLSDQKLEKVPKFLKAAYRPKPNTSICLNKDFPMIEGLCFNNMSEAQKSMAVAQWHAPQEDETIPKTEEEHRRIVRMLVDAFKDMSIAKDTATNAYRKRFTPGETSYYQNWAIEACAWDIIDKAKYIHTEGFNIPIYDKSIVEYIGQTQKWLFGERIDWICQVLKSSKHVAVTLMKHEKNWVTIGAPHKLYSSTLVNTISNAHRGKWIKDGRGADRNHQDRPFKSKRTKDQVTFSEGEVVGIDLPNNVDSGTVAGSEETGAQNQELIRKRQKIEQIIVESKDFDMDDAITAESDAGVQSVEKPEKSHMSNEFIINSMVDSSDGDLPTKSFAVDPRQDACVNFYLDTNTKGRSESDNGSESDNESELSEPPDGLLPDALYASPINKKTGDPRVNSSTLEPRVDDTAHLDGAHMLVSLSASR